MNPLGLRMACNELLEIVRQVNDEGRLTPAQCLLVERAKALMHDERASKNSPLRVIQGGKREYDTSDPLEAIAAEMARDGILVGSSA